MFDICITQETGDSTVIKMINALTGVDIVGNVKLYMVKKWRTVKKCMNVLNVAFDYQTGATRWTRSHMTRRDLTWIVTADSADVEMIRLN